MPGKTSKGRRVSDAQYARRTRRLRAALLEAQAALRRSRAAAVVMIVTGAPSAGRSELMNELLGWLDPKFVTVHAPGAPDRYERQRPPMWRYWRAIPARGRVAFQFSGWYQEPMNPRSAAAGRDRERFFARIRQLETMLSRDGVRVLKIHLHVDARTQRRRLAHLRADEATRWRVTREDRWLAQHYPAVKRVADRCIQATQQPCAPWHLIDASDETHRLLAAGALLRDALRGTLRGGRRGAPRDANTALSGASARSSPSPVSRDPQIATGRARAVVVPMQARQVRPERLAKREYRRELEALQGRLALLVRRRRFRRHALVLVFEGIDAAGKGGAIRRVTRALDARQYQVVPVSAPSAQEREYPYLWRFWRDIPRLDRIAIFDRSWYGRVLVERVRGYTPAEDWRRAYEEIRELERQLTEHGVAIAKFWIDVSKAEQLRRLQARNDDPLKRFKVDPEDWVNRRYYDEYQSAAAEMLQRTDTPQARWTVVAGDDKRRARLSVLARACEALESLR